MAGPGPQPILPGIGPSLHVPKPNFRNPPDFGLGPGANSTSPNTGSPTSGDDWSHLFTRIAEFGIGAILIAVGINYLFLKSKTGQTVVNIAAGTATGGTGRVARGVRTAQRT